MTTGENQAFCDGLYLLDTFTMLNGHNIYENAQKNRILAFCESSQNWGLCSADKKADILRLQPRTFETYHSGGNVVSPAGSWKNYSVVPTVV